MTRYTTQVLVALGIALVAYGLGQIVTWVLARRRGDGWEEDGPNGYRDPGVHGHRK